MTRIAKKILWTTLLVLVACSPQKNTFVSRSYNGLVSHYNIYFNAKESYKKGIARINTGYKNDYNQLLSVFTYNDKTLNASASSEMDVAIKKATKVITQHSIKAKPKVKNTRLSPSEKEFLARNEYNPWVGYSYMLIVKADFYKFDFVEAAKTISFIQREFPRDPVHYEALIWQARIHIMLNEFTEADKILNNLSGEKKLPKKFQSDLNATYADLYIHKQQYKQAEAKLEKALETVHNKTDKIRYHYILAQLNQQLGEDEKAITHYNKVIKLNPPYEMTFNSRINLAGLVGGDSRGNKNIKSQLYKMLKDQKNKDFQDQIYFTLANMEMREKNEERAINLFKQAAAASSGNDVQKATIYLTLADFYYGKKNYMQAQAYYDSTMEGLKPEYKEYGRVKSRAGNLNKLVKNLNTISLQDSLLHLATLSENERMKIVNQIIRDVQNKELEEQQKKQEENQSTQLNLNRNNMSASTTGKWYFYNTMSVLQGKTEFQAKWGKRQLEDNWRRRNKSMTVLSDNTDQEEGGGPVQENKISDNKKPEYYLQNIPVTDSMKTSAHAKMQEAFMNAAATYNENLNEPEEAVKLYAELLKRYPEGLYAPAAAYQIYSISNSGGNTARATQYKQLVMTRYSNSIYAQVLSNPEYAKKAAEEENRVNVLYEQTYQLYQQGNYLQVIQNADLVLKNLKDKVLASKFSFVRALSMGKTSDVTAFRRELEKVIAGYPNTDVSIASREIIQKIDNFNPDVKKTEETIRAEATYIPEDHGALILVYLVAPGEDINQLVFDIINFNLDNFGRSKFEIQNGEMGKDYKFISVNKFTNRKDALAYYYVFHSSELVTRNLKNKKNMMFVISEENFRILQTDKIPDTYQRFFEKNFLGK